jgi:YHS domain-containing protein
MASAGPSTSSSFADSLSSVFAAHEKSLQAARSTAATDAKQLEANWAQLATVHKQLATDVLRPALETLNKKFGELKPVVEKDMDGAMITLPLPRDDAHPADAGIRIHISRDDDFKNVLITFRFGVIPVFMELEPEQSHQVSIASPDMAKTKAWFDERFVNAVKAYLSIETNEYYQRQNSVMDPVLKELFPKHFAVGSIEHGGSTYFFKSEESKRMFTAEPEKFAKRV